MKLNNHFENEVKNSTLHIKGFKLAHWVWENSESAEQKLIEDFNINHVDIKNYKFKVRDEIVSIQFTTSDSQKEIQVSSLDMILRIHYYIWRKR